MTFTAKAWQDSPNDTTPISASALVDLEERVATHGRTFGPAPTTTLPGSPANGQMVFYKPVSSSASPVWHCVWDSALNGGSGAWAVVGGAGIGTRNNTGYSGLGSTGWANTGAAGPTIPVAGLYHFEWGAFAAHSLANGWVLLRPNPVPASDDDAVRSQLPATASGQWVWGRTHNPVTCSAAATTVQYRTVGGNLYLDDIICVATPVELRP